MLINRIYLNPETEPNAGSTSEPEANTSRGADVVAPPQDNKTSDGTPPETSNEATVNHKFTFDVNQPEKTGSEPNGTPPDGTQPAQTPPQAIDEPYADLSAEDKERLEKTASFLARKGGEHLDFLIEKFDERTGGQVQTSQRMNELEIKLEKQTLINRLRIPIEFEDLVTGDTIAEITKSANRIAGMHTGLQKQAADIAKEYFEKGQTASGGATETKTPDESAKPSASPGVTTPSVEKSEVKLPEYGKGVLSKDEASAQFMGMDVDVYKNLKNR